MLQESVEQQWYHRPSWLLLLAPLTLVYAHLSKRRRRRLTARQRPLPVPLIVIGNIALGGTGKTPLILALIELLRNQGYQPGVIASGYKGSISASQMVPREGQADIYGDEPVLLARLGGCPVAVGRDRVASVQCLLAATDCDVILSDDGLQHYRMPRDIEIALVDGQRGFGNGWLLPVGPLRETPERLWQVDCVLVNGPNQRNVKLPEDRLWSTQLAVVNWKNLRTGATLEIEELPLAGAQAIAGIGNPQRFFQQLRQLGFDGETRSFADHHHYSAEDFTGCEQRLVLMTEKDAVKCQTFAGPNWWALQVSMILPESLQEFLLTKIAATLNNKATAGVK